MAIPSKDFCDNYQLTDHEMLKKMKKIETNRTKPGNPYYLVLFENRTKPGTVLSETVLSGDPLCWKILEVPVYQY